MLSIELLTRAADILAHKCVEGISANQDKCREWVEHSLITAPVLLPHLGYGRTAEAVKLAREQKTPIRQAVKNLGYLSKTEADSLLNYHKLAKPGIVPLDKQED